MPEDPHNPADALAAASDAWFVRFRRPLIAIALLTSIITAISGLWLNLPLESHEVFVARTAEEMIARADYIVPYINDAPRLKKPPINYWLVIAVDRLAGADGDIAEWESRAPSALAAIGLSIVTLLLGMRLFNTRAAIIGSLLLASSSGYMTYSHSARPEMTYALFCAAGLLCLVNADVLRHRRSTTRDETAGRSLRAAPWPSVVYSYLAWLLFGLGMLAKGPQLQVPIILGWVAAMLWNRRGRDILPTLRPLVGIIIFIAVSGWWYYAVHQRVGSATDVWIGETVARVAERDKPKIRYVDPYYVYRTAVLLLPWVVFYVFALLAPVSRELRRSRPARILWCVAVMPMILLWFSLNRRWYYMLPVIAPIITLMAAFAMRWADQFHHQRRAGWWRNLLLGHIIALAAGAVYLAGDGDGHRHLSLVSTAAVLIAAVVAIVACLRINNDDRPTGDRAFIATILVAGVFMTAAAADGALWSLKRADVRDSTLRIAEHVSPHQPLYGWRDNWVTEVYYLDRPIPTLHTVDQLSERAAEHDDVWLIAHDDETLQLPDTLTGRLVFDVDYARAGGKQLWRITNAATDAATGHPHPHQDH